MATSGSRDWAYGEARRRAVDIGDACNVYRNRDHSEDYIVRITTGAPPRDFRLMATIQPDGSYSFGPKD